MNLILLPGNNKSNRAWIDAIERELNPHFAQTAVHYYDHWWGDDSDVQIDLEAELLKLTATVQTYNSYVIFAKSAGVLLALYGIFEGVLDPDVCIFVGSAVNWGHEQGFDLDSWLTNFSVPTLFIQQRNDPAISASDLQLYLDAKNVTGYQFVTLDGDDHLYADTDKLCELTLEFYEP